ncbi:MAG: hypothetical protein H6978_09080 [Gammaproteobacteria bacterium]|nr:hypothetical protein [Gammaproteobacteria bacterium]
MDNAINFFMVDGLVVDALAVVRRQFAPGIGGGRMIPGVRGRFRDISPPGLSHGFPLPGAGITMRNDTPGKFDRGDNGAGTDG